MKILHVITDLDVGGAETSLYRVASRMTSSGFISRVVSLIEPGPIGSKLEESGCTVDCLDMKRGIPSPKGLFKLVRLIRHWKPDIVQTWLYHADLLGLIAARLAFPLSTGPKVAWNIRCSYMELSQYRRMTSLTLRACAALSGMPDLVLTNSHEARRFHTSIGYSPKRFEVIPNGFDTDLFHPDTEAGASVREELSIPSETPLIGHVARYDTMKDHATLIHAASEVTRKTGAIFMLIGRGVDGDNMDIAARMREAGLAPEYVRLLGERKDMPRLMAAMDLHISSSLGESFPNTVGETMSCGISNVVTAVGDSGLLVDETGTVVPPANPTALAEAINTFLALPVEQRRTMSKAARKRIVTRFSLETTVTEYIKKYRNLRSIQ